MVLSDEKMRECSKKILSSRMRLLMNNGFYGLLLMNMRFALDAECEKAATDGEKIFFNPGFLLGLNEREIDFVLMHEVLHAALGHCFRLGEREPERFQRACDIVVNSNILYSCGMNVASIALSGVGICEHKTPKGDEGYEYTAEEVYEMLAPVKSQQVKNGDGSHKSKKKSPDTEGEDGTGAGKKKKGKGEKNGNSDSADFGDEETREDGNEGTDANGGNSRKSTGKETKNPKQWDDHSRWTENVDMEAADRLKEEWKDRVIRATETIKIDEASISMGGGAPRFAQRMYDIAHSNQIDWREVLNDFVQDEINDYSFSPPDRRFDDSPFFLPDFNERDETVENIWFVVDTSGSIGDKELGAAFAEICNAIEQFNGKLKGKLSFSERFVTEPVDFESVEDINKIVPRGGGGNDFADIFRYMEKNMAENLPKYIVIITDGYDSFPPEKMAMGVPVMWLINNDRVYPPWGKVARLDIN